MVAFTVDFFGVRESQVAINRIRIDYKIRSREAVRTVAELAAKEAKGNVRVDSGAIQEEIGWVEDSSGDDFGARVGTGKPYGARLELDYVGPDSLNRTFDHVTLPAQWLGPVADKIPGWLAQEMRI